ncbi:SRPBCC domain-containing protein [Paenochrobactrum sp. BZR 588]|uniref:SRPBCC family protein n=1 Tax=unclassified Paenochrobactrum TaxID=2639760 RepID=UPI00385237B7
MSEKNVADKSKTLVFEYELEATPQKLWRALTIAEFRAKWLPELAQQQAEPGSLIPQKQICYKIREKTPPFLESHITFRISVRDDGKALLTIIHELTDTCVRPMSQPANNNQSPLMMAA